MEAKKDDDKATSASVVYVPGPEDPASVVWNGKTFTAGQPVEITDPIMIESAKGNPSFNVDGEDKAKAAEERREQEAADKVKAVEAQLEADWEKMRERHAGERDQLEKQQDAEMKAFEVRAKQSLPGDVKPRPGKVEGKPAQTTPPTSPAGNSAASPPPPNAPAI